LNGGKKISVSAFHREGENYVNKSGNYITGIP